MTTDDNSQRNTEVDEDVPPTFDDFGLSDEHEEFLRRFGVAGVITSQDVCCDEEEEIVMTAFYESWCNSDVLSKTTSRRVVISEVENLGMPLHKGLEDASNESHPSPSVSLLEIAEVKSRLVSKFMSWFLVDAKLIKESEQVDTTVSSDSSLSLIVGMNETLQNQLSQFGIHSIKDLATQNEIPRGILDQSPDILERAKDIFVLLSHSSSPKTKGKLAGIAPPTSTHLTPATQAVRAKKWGNDTPSLEISEMTVLEEDKNMGKDFSSSSLSDLVKPTHLPTTQLSYASASISLAPGPFAPLSILIGVDDFLEQRLLLEFIYTIHQLARLPEDSNLVYTDLKAGEAPVDNIDELVQMAQRIVFLSTGETFPPLPSISSTLSITSSTSPTAPSSPSCSFDLVLSDSSSTSDSVTSLELLQLKEKEDVTPPLPLPEELADPDHWPAPITNRSGGSGKLTIKNTKKKKKRSVVVL